MYKTSILLCLIFDTFLFRETLNFPILFGSTNARVEHDKRRSMKFLVSTSEFNRDRMDNLVSKGAADGVLVSGYLRLPSSCASLATS